MGNLPRFTYENRIGDYDQFRSMCRRGGPLKTNASSSTTARTRNGPPSHANVPAHQPDYGGSPLPPLLKTGCVTRPVNARSGKFSGAEFRRVTKMKFWSFTSYQLPGPDVYGFRLRAVSSARTIGTSCGVRQHYPHQHPSLYDPVTSPLRPGYRAKKTRGNEQSPQKTFWTRCWKGGYMTRIPIKGLMRNSIYHGSSVRRRCRRQRRQDTARRPPTTPIS